MTNKTDNRRVTKVKYNGSRVIIEYEVPKSGGESDELMVKSCDPPDKSFTDAFESLAGCVAEACEIPATVIYDWTASIKVTGVSYSYSNDIMGAVITGQKSLQLSQAPLIINTPHKPSEPYSTGDPNAGDYCLPRSTIMKLQALHAAALAYVDGHRKQMALFDPQLQSEAA